MGRYELGDVHGWWCRYCGVLLPRGGGHLEHVVPFSSAVGDPEFMKWVNHPDNFVLACARCNLSKGPRDPVQWYNDLKRKGRLGEVPYLESFLVEMSADVGHTLWNPRGDQKPHPCLALMWLEGPDAHDEWALDRQFADEDDS